MFQPTTLDRVWHQPRQSFPDYKSHFYTYKNLSTTTHQASYSSFCIFQEINEYCLVGHLERGFLLLCQISLSWFCRVYQQRMMIVWLPLRNCYKSSMFTTVTLIQPILSLQTDLVQKDVPVLFILKKLSFPELVSSSQPVVDRPSSIEQRLEAPVSRLPTKLWRILEDIRIPW